MSLYSLFKGRGPSGFGYGSSAEDVTDGVDLSGQRILITGCNSGIGLESMRVLSKRGAHVIALARSVEKAEKAAASVGAEVTPVACELAKPESVRAAVETVSGLEGARHMNPLVRVTMSMANPLVMKSLGEGAATQCYVAANPQTASTTGEYFADCNVAKSSRQGRDMELAKRLWTETEEIVAGL